MSVKNGLAQLEHIAVNDLLSSTFFIYCRILYLAIQSTSVNDLQTLYF